MRARLNVLSELPGAWKQATTRWARINRRGRMMVDGESFPSRNEEYLFYQTLLGTWPLHPMDAAEAREYRDRIVGYMQKAMREAKVFTSWLNPSELHEQAMTRFIDAALGAESRVFREDFLPFQRRVADYGIYNSLAQIAIKIGAPGVPDVYQGTELWDFSLVDPDNRRPVDYMRRCRLLRELHAAVQDEGMGAVATRLMADPRDDRVKLYATSNLLRFRRDHLEMFQRGGYHPLQVHGARREHLFAFARGEGEDQVVVAVPRLIATLLPDADVPPLGERVWGDTHIALPEDRPRRYRHVLTNDVMCAHAGGEGQTLAAADVFAHFPIAFLEGQHQWWNGRKSF